MESLEDQELTLVVSNSRGSTTTARDQGHCGCTRVLNLSLGLVVNLGVLELAE